MPQSGECGVCNLGPNHHEGSCLQQMGRSWGKKLSFILDAHLLLDAGGRWGSKSSMDLGKNRVRVRAEGYKEARRPIQASPDPQQIQVGDHQPTAGHTGRVFGSREEIRSGCRTQGGGVWCFGGAKSAKEPR